MELAPAPAEPRGSSGLIAGTHARARGVGDHNAQIRRCVMAITSISRAVEDKSPKKILATDGGAKFLGKPRAFARETIEIDDVWNAGMCNA